MIKIKNWNKKIISEKAESSNVKFVKSYLENSRRSLSVKREYSLKKFTVEKKAIKDNCSSKCMFCESKGNFQLSIFRPLSLSRLIKREDINDGYWWFAYDTANFIYICNGCEESKGNYFPVKGRRAPFPISYDKVDKAEKRLIVDPRYDSPEKHLKFNAGGEVEALSKIGQYTIEVFGLNRSELIRKRSNVVKDLFAKFDLDEELSSPHWYKKGEYDTEGLINELSNESEFSSLKRWILSPIIKKLKLSKALVKTYKVSSYIKAPRKRKFKVVNQCNVIDSLEIKNFMGIKSVKIEFDSKDSNLVVVGNNGSGKSSLLKALSFLSLSNVQRTNYLIENRNTVYRFGSNQKSQISIKYNNGEKKYSIEIDGDLNEIYEKGEKPRFRLLGYGPNRLNARREFYRKPSTANVYPLMKPYYFLSHSHVWLGDESVVDEKLFENISFKIAELFQLKPIDVVRDNGDLELKLDASFERFQDLSEGYRSVLNIVLDIIMNFSEETYDFDTLNGIVLIDEIENHLHPLWKKEIVGFLTTMFPNIQFVVSSHDPLVLHSTEKSKILKFSRQKNEINIYSLPRGRSTDEILTSSLFGLDSTIDRETSLLYREYLSQISNSETYDEKLEVELRKRMGNFAETSLERMAHKVVADSVQKNYKSLTEKQKTNLRNKLLKLNE